MERTIPKNWSFRNDIDDKTILKQIHSSAALILNNQHLEFFQDLKDKVLSTYKVTAEFTHLGYNGDSIICNNQTLVYRNGKFKPVSFHPNVKLVKGKFANQGGSNGHPSVGYEGFKVTLEFESYGLPVVNSINGWSIHIIEMIKQ